MRVANYIENAKAIAASGDLQEAMRLCRNLAKEKPADKSILYYCKSHGDWDAATVSGCPECIKEFRSILRHSRGA